MDTVNEGTVVRGFTVVKLPHSEGFTAMLTGTKGDTSSSAVGSFNIIHDFVLYCMLGKI